jgi:hypothetical protein
MDVGGRGALRFVQGEQELGVELDFLRAHGAKASPPADDVSRDGEEPRARLLRPVAAPQRAKGVQERSLGDVLCLVGIAHVAQHRAVNLAPVPTVDPLEGTIGIHECFMPENSLLKRVSLKPLPSYDDTRRTPRPKRVALS